MFDWMKRERRGRSLRGVLLAGLVVAGGQRAVHAEGSGAELRAKVLAAYAETGTYRSTTKIHATRVGEGGREDGESLTVGLAFDRGAGRLAVRRSDQVLVCEGQDARLKLEGISERYLSARMPGALDFQWLMGNVPTLSQPPLPEVALLMYEQGKGVLDTECRLIMPRADDPRQGLRFEGDDCVMKMTLWVAPESHMVTGAAIEWDVAKARGGQGEQAKMVLTYEMVIEQHGGLIEPGVFAFDPGGAEAVGTFRELVSGASGSGVGQGSGHPLEGRRAPGVSLETLSGQRYDLANEEADVVVLDFWATWCGPCRMAMPKLQAFYDWAKANHKSVAVYAVNLRESKSQVQRYWKKEGFSIPVLMDKDAAVAAAYRVEGIPQTVVIGRGKVCSVHVGYSADLERILKSEVAEILSRSE